MPEIKNTFLASKMNKDVDARLLPNGEYRDALNVGINTSEGSDIGALENILGNIEVADFGLSTTCNLEVIGKCVDEVNERLFVFITNWDDGSASNLNTSLGALATYVKCYICMYDARNQTESILVQGTFLNFSKTNIITGVNVLENYLFWTDNRNQPRKINIDSALSNSSFYTREEQISVAKPAPYKAIELYKTFGGTAVSTMLDVTSEYLPDGQTNNPYYDATWGGDGEYLNDKFVRFSYRYKFIDGEYSLIAPFTQIAFIPEQDGYFINREAIPAVASSIAINDDDKTYVGTDVDFMVNKVNRILLQIPVPQRLDGVGLWSSAFNDLHISEVDILYKESNETSIKVVETIKRSTFETVTSGSLEYIYNSTKPHKTLPSSEIIRVSDIVPIKALAQTVSGNRIIYGNYINRHASPADLNYYVSTNTKQAVADSADRIEYPNHNLKQNRSYQVGIVLQDYFGRQSNVILSSQDNNTNNASTIYHPYRLSGATPALFSATDTWPGDNLVVNFASAIPDQDPGNIGYPGLYSTTNPLGWYTYRVVVKQKEQEYYNIYFPGILNGYTDPDGAAGSGASTSDPTVHFVLHGDNIDKVPRDLTELGPDQKIFRSAERNTNVKMFSSLADEQWMKSQPRTQEEISDYYAQQDALFRDSVSTVPENSSLDVFLRVNTDTTGSSAADMVNKQHFFPTNFIKPDNVTTIGTLTDLGLYDGTSATIAKTNPVYYNYQSKPLIAQTSVQDTTIGETAANAFPFLGVYETKPIKSALELFWETTTNGDVASLNTLINASDTESVVKFEDTVYAGSGSQPGPVSILYENIAIGADATQVFKAVNSTGATRTTSTGTLVSVINGLGADVTSDYSLTSLGSGTYKLVTAAKVVSSLNYAQTARYNTGLEFQLTVTIRMVSSNAASAIITNNSFNINILNVAPQYVAPASAAVESITTTPTANTSLYTIIATNGSINEYRWGEDIEFEITSQTISGGAAVNYFFLNNQIIDSSNRATIKLYHDGADNTTAVPTGVYDIVVKFRDRPVGPIDFTKTLNFQVTVS
tara:strand:+ start:1849 stop:4989 length:3141 start_codon:yes stop_codon:yes gene_type:complete